MKKFIWLASFPKSGSTWLRFITAHLLFDVGEDNPGVRAMVPSFHDWRGDLTYSWQGAHPVKIHLAAEFIPRRTATHSAIYIIRNPLDVVDSAINYFKPSAAARDDIINQFCQYGSTEPWYSTLNYTSWDNNADSWINGKHDFPLLTLRYEDLLEDTQSNVRRIADFLAVDTSAAKIKKVVKETSFKQMKKVEDQELETGVEGVFHDEHKYAKKEFTFMRSGKSGGYRDNLTESEISRLLEYFAPHMEKFGYL